MAKDNQFNGNQQGFSAENDTNGSAKDNSRAVSPVSRTQKIVVIAFLSAISFIFYYLIAIPLPFFPTFLKLQISDIGAVIGGLMYGPIVGSIIVVVKILLKIVFDFGSSVGVGELSDLFLGLAFMLPPSLIYKKYKSNKAIIISLCISAVLSTVIAIFTNYFFIIPLYVNVYLGGWDVLINMVIAFYPSITVETFYNFYIPFAVIPFNLLRGIVCGVATYFLFKGLKSFDKKLF